MMTRCVTGNREDRQRQWQNETVGCVLLDHRGDFSKFKNGLESPTVCVVKALSVVR
jgi:hypothetical protein